jgi:hypothetical protein
MSTTKQTLYAQIERTRKTAKYMRSLAHSLSCRAKCGDSVCFQTTQYIKHIETCPFVSAGNMQGHGSCSLAGCNTTYVLIDHLRKHRRISPSNLPKCFDCYDIDNDNNMRLSLDSLCSNNTERTSSFDSTDSTSSDDNNASKNECKDNKDINFKSTVGIHNTCLLCQLAFASVDEEREILNLVHGSKQNSSNDNNSGTSGNSNDDVSSNCSRNINTNESITQHGPISPTASRLYNHWHRQVKQKCACYIANLVPFCCHTSPPLSSPVSYSQSNGNHNHNHNHAHNKVSSHAHMKCSIHNESIQHGAESLSDLESHSNNSQQTSINVTSSVVLNGHQQQPPKLKNQQQDDIIIVEEPRQFHVSTTDVDFEEVKQMFRQSMGATARTQRVITMKATPTSASSMPSILTIDTHTANRKRLSSSVEDEDKYGDGDGDCIYNGDGNGNVTTPTDAKSGGMMTRMRKSCRTER